MDILNKSINEITFSDVEAFCELKIIEGVTLEYKQDFPKDLSKQFVTFSNTKGGLIIIGIVEDAQTGLPEKWEGIDTTTKPIDRVYQVAANVFPFPTFQVALTDEKNGRAFVLIRIIEGSSPPYSTNSDPTPWVRTGNISTPIQPANREELFRLINKNDQAKISRESSIEFARHTFQLDLAAAERERKDLLANPNNQTVYSRTLGTGEDDAIFEVSILPFYPSRELFTGNELLPIHTFLGNAWQNSPFTGDTKSIPGGLSAFGWSHHSGNITSGQIYFNGHSFMAMDVLRSQGNNAKTVHSYMIGAFIHNALEVSRTLFQKTNYNGQVSIIARLSGGVGAATTPPSNNPFDHTGILQYSQYDWSWETDTAAVLNDDSLAELHKKMLKRVCWDIGLEVVSDTTIQQFFATNRWYGL